MKIPAVKISVMITLIGLSVSVFPGCSTYRTLIDKQKIAAIPEGRYERIIKLYNPDGAPDKTLAGIVFLKEGAKVCTDYPREETIKSLEDLDVMEKYAYQSFSRYAIAAEGKIFGYFAIPLETRALIYQNSQPENCIYKVVIIEPKRHSDTDRIPNIDPGVR